MRVLRATEFWSSARTASGSLCFLRQSSELCASPTAGSFADDSFEHGREVGLCLEPNGQRNVEEFARGLQEEPFGSLDPLQKNEVMRSAARCKTELRCEMRS